MKGIWFLVLAVSVGLNVGLAYSVLSPGGDRRGPGLPRPAKDFAAILEGHLDRMTASLGLDERQRAAITAVHEELFPGIASGQKAVKNLRREVASAYVRPTLEAEEFRSLVQRLGRERERLDSLVAEAMLGEAAVLTPEQRRKYAREMPWGQPPPHPDRRPAGTRR